MVGLRSITTQDKKMFKIQVRAWVEQGHVRRILFGRFSVQGQMIRLCWSPEEVARSLSNEGQTDLRQIAMLCSAAQLVLMGFLMGFCT